MPPTQDAVNLDAALKPSAPEQPMLRTQPAQPIAAKGQENPSNADRQPAIRVTPITRNATSRANCCKIFWSRTAPLDRRHGLRPTHLPQERLHGRPHRQNRPASHGNGAPVNLKEAHPVASGEIKHRLSARACIVVKDYMKRFTLVVFIRSDFCLVWCARRRTVR